MRRALVTVTLTIIVATLIGGFLSLAPAQSPGPLRVGARSADVTIEPSTTTAPPTAGPTVCYDGHGLPLPTQLAPDGSCPPCWYTTTPSTTIPVGTADPCEIALSTPTTSTTSAPAPQPPPPTEAPQTAVQPLSGAFPSDEWWYALGACEQPSPALRAGDVSLRGTVGGVEWTVHGPDYEGGLGFAVSTWAQYHDPTMPPNAGDATPAQQIAVARRLYGLYGSSPWGCARVIAAPF